MDQWMIHMKKADFEGLHKEFNIDVVTARIIRNRDVISVEDFRRFLYGTIKDMWSPFLMKDMEKAVTTILLSISKQEKIRIIGDYDIDGVCSTYILVRGLRLLGADVDFSIPNRISDGYGLNERLILGAYEDGVNLIITCDNGIAAKEQIDLAYEKGMHVVVTDHHEIPFIRKEDDSKEYIIPKADAVVDTKQEMCKYPEKEICGGLVAYKLIQALMMKSGRLLPEFDELLQFAAFATVGDVMNLTGENRIVVKYGLKQMMDTQNIGLKALIEVSGLNGSKLTTYHLGFVLGPCLNATGRLDTAIRALNLFLTDKREEALEIANELKGLNDSRKDMTQKGVQQAIDLIENSDLMYDKVLVVYLPECHESLAGIIAGRLRERYVKPVFVLTDSETGIKGSGRSIEAYSMYDEINKVSGLLTKYGGHKMAAGLSMDSGMQDKFRLALNENCSLKEDDFVNKIYADMELPTAGYITESLIHEMECLEPFGTGNPHPLFVLKNIQLLQCRVFGKNKNVLKCTSMDEKGYRFNMIYFGETEEIVRKAEQNLRISALLYPEINEYRGEHEIQFVLKSYH